MSSSLQHFRRSERLLIAVLLAIPAVVSCLVLVESASALLPIPASAHFAMKTRLDVSAELIAAMEMLPVPVVSSVASNPTLLVAPTFHVIGEKNNVSHGARAPAAK